MNKIILLDLNYTLVENSKDSWPDFSKDPNLQIETYRNWLVDLMRGYEVVLITVRADRLQQATLDNIQRLTQWQPQASYFKTPAQTFVRAAKFKQAVLREFIYPKYGELPSRYLALESNAETRGMYQSEGIAAYPVPNKAWRTLPILENQLQYLGRVPTT